MKKIILFLILCSWAGYQCQAAEKNGQTNDRTVVATFVVPANKAYAEPFVTGNPGVSVPVGWVESRGSVSDWSDRKRSVVWYVYQKQGTYDLDFALLVEKQKHLSFQLNVTECYDMGFKKIMRTLKMNGTGEADTLFAASLTIPQTGYYRYELKPIAAPEKAITINSLLFKAYTSGAQVNHIDYQSSPSVHLSFRTTEPTTRSYDWIYEEILVPKGSDPLATYYMSLGFFRGYMGIQTNSTTERRVLFSVWDSKDADHDKTMVAEDFVSLVDKDKQTTVNSFGNEGTGGQSYVKTANWQTGKPVKFLMNTRRMDNNSILISAWYSVSDKEGWKYVATWRAPHEQRMFDGFYSFIENYGYTNGQIPRKAYYYNAWGKEDATGKWVNFNKVGFSHTDGREGQRVDYEQGVAPEFPERFYMASGGYTPTVKTGDEIKLLENPPLTDLSVFQARVDKALENEPVHKEAVKKEVRGK